jgi:hypothetical protein
MFYRKVFTSLFYLIFIAGCATTYAPTGWLPDTDDTQKEAYGGWMTLIVKPDKLNADVYYLQYGGEFISTDSNSVYLLADSLYIVPKDKVTSAILEIDDKSSMEYGLWTAGGCLSTISNGYYLIFTAPLWLLFGVPTATGESYRDRYEYNEEISTDLMYWEDVQKFARFPQGINDQINMNALTPKDVEKIDN